MLDKEVMKETRKCVIEMLNHPYSFMDNKEFKTLKFWYSFFYDRILEEKLKPRPKGKRTPKI